MYMVNVYNLMSLYLHYINETITTVKVEDNSSKLYFQVKDS